MRDLGSVLLCSSGEAAKTKTVSTQLVRGPDYRNVPALVTDERVEDR
jgi:hypothetical protein